MPEIPCSTPTWNHKTILIQDLPYIHTYIHSYIHTYTRIHTYTHIHTYKLTYKQHINTYIPTLTYIHTLHGIRWRYAIRSFPEECIHRRGRHRRISSHFFPCRLRFIHLAAVAPWIDSGVRRWRPTSWKLLHLIKSRCCWRFISKDLREDPSHHKTRQSELIWLFC